MVRWVERSAVERVHRQPMPLTMILNKCIIFAISEYQKVLQSLPQLAANGHDPKLVLWYHARHMREVFLRLRVLCALTPIYGHISRANEVFESILTYRQNLRMTSFGILDAIFIPGQPRPAVAIANDVLTTGDFPRFPTLSDDLVRCIDKDVCMPARSPVEMLNIMERINIELRLEFVRSKLLKRVNGSRVIAKVVNGRLWVSINGEFALCLLSDFTRWLVLDATILPSRPLGLSADVEHTQLVQRLVQLAIEEVGRRVLILNNRRAAALLISKKNAKRKALQEVIFEKLSAHFHYSKAERLAKAAAGILLPNEPAIWSEEEECVPSKPEDIILTEEEESEVQKVELLDEEVPDRIKLDPLAVAVHVTHALVSLTAFAALQEQAGVSKLSTHSPVVAWGVDRAEDKGAILLDKLLETQKVKKSLQNIDPSMEADGDGTTTTVMNETCTPANPLSIAAAATILNSPIKKEEEESKDIKIDDATSDATGEKHPFLTTYAEKDKTDLLEEWKIEEDVLLREGLGLRSLDVGIFPEFYISRSFYNAIVTAIPDAAITPAYMKHKGVNVCATNAVSTVSQAETSVAQEAAALLQATKQVNALSVTLPLSNETTSSNGDNKSTTTTQKDKSDVDSIPRHPFLRFSVDERGDLCVRLWPLSWMETVAKETWETLGSFLPSALAKAWEAGKLRPTRLLNWRSERLELGMWVSRALRLLSSWRLFWINEASIEALGGTKQEVNPEVNGWFGTSLSCDAHGHARRLEIYLWEQRIKIYIDPGTGKLLINLPFVSSGIRLFAEIGLAKDPASIIRALPALTRIALQARVSATGKSIGYLPVADHALPLLQNLPSTATSGNTSSIALLGSDSVTDMGIKQISIGNKPTTTTTTTLSASAALLVKLLSKAAGMNTSLDFTEPSGLVSSTWFLSSSLAGSSALSSISFAIPGSHWRIRFVLKGMTLDHFSLVLPRRPEDASYTHDPLAAPLLFASVPIKCQPIDLTAMSSSATENACAASIAASKTSVKNNQTQWAIRIAKNILSNAAANANKTKSSIINRSTTATTSNKASVPPITSTNPSSATPNITSSNSSDSLSSSASSALLQLIEVLHTTKFLLSAYGFSSHTLSDLAAVPPCAEGFPFILRPEGSFSLDVDAVLAKQAENRTTKRQAAKEVAAANPIWIFSVEPLRHAAEFAPYSTLNAGSATINEGTPILGPMTLRIDISKRYVGLAISPRTFANLPRIVMPRTFPPPVQDATMAVHVDLVSHHWHMTYHADPKSCSACQILTKGTAEPLYTSAKCCHVFQGQQRAWQATPPFAPLVAGPLPEDNARTSLDFIVKTFPTSNSTTHEDLPPEPMRSPIGANPTFLLGSLCLSYEKWLGSMGGAVIAYDLHSLLKCLEASFEFWRATSAWGATLHIGYLMPHRLRVTFSPPYLEREEFNSKHVSFDLRIKSGITEPSPSANRSRLVALSGVGVSQDLRFAVPPKDQNLSKELSYSLTPPPQTFALPPPSPHSGDLAVDNAPRIVPQELQLQWLAGRWSATLRTWSKTALTGGHLFPFGNMVCKTSHQILPFSNSLGRELSYSSQSLSRTVMRLVFRNIELHSAVAQVVYRRLVAAELDPGTKSDDPRIGTLPAVRKALDRWTFVYIDSNTVRMAVVHQARRATLLFQMHPSSPGILRVSDGEIVGARDKVAIGTQQSYTLRLFTCCQILSWQPNPAWPDAIRRSLAVSLPNAPQCSPQRGPHEIRFMPGHVLSSVIEPLATLMLASCAFHEAAATLKQLGMHAETEQSKANPATAILNHSVATALSPDVIRQAVGPWVSLSWLPNLSPQGSGGGGSVASSQQAQTAEDMSIAPRKLEIVAQLVEIGALPVPGQPAPANWSFHPSYLPGPIPPSMRLPIQRISPSSHPAPDTALMLKRIQWLLQDAPLATNVASFTDHITPNSDCRSHGGMIPLLQTDIDSIAAMLSSKSLSPSDPLQSSLASFTNQRSQLERLTLMHGPALLPQLTYINNQNGRRIHATLRFSLQLADLSFGEGIPHLQDTISNRLALRNIPFIMHLSSLKASVRALPSLTPLLEAEARSCALHVHAALKKERAKVPLLSLDFEETSLKPDPAEPASKVFLSNAVIRARAVPSVVHLDAVPLDVKELLLARRIPLPELKFSLTVSKLPPVTADQIYINQINLQQLLNFAHGQNLMNEDWALAVRQIIELRGNPLAAFVRTLLQGEASFSTLTKLVQFTLQIHKTTQQQQSTKK